MVLAIGLVVDDAIVVLENIHRHIEEGLKPIDAAIVGMKEIFVPIVSMTITLAAVYAPIGFTQGLTGTLFREFAFTLAGAVVISGIIAVTLVADDVRHAAQAHGHGGQKGFAGFVDRTFTQAGELVFAPPLGLARLPAHHAVIVAALLGTTVFLFMKTPSELAPEEDQGAYLGLVNTPQYATVDYTQAFAAGFTRAGEKIPEIDDTFLIAGIDGGGSGFVGFKLKEWSRTFEEGRSDQAGHPGLLNENAGVQAFVFSPPSLPGAGGGLPIQYVLRTIGDPAQAYEVGEQVKQKAHGLGQVHRGPELGDLSDAPRAHHRGSRPSGIARCAGERDRHHPRRAGGRRVDRQVRPR